LQTNETDPEARPTGSYDMPPPDGSIGVSCWVTAATAGDAAETALRAVSDAATQVTGASHPLWDLRLLPASAVMGRDEYDQRRSE
jgi:hypothetical protein